MRKRKNLTRKRRTRSRKSFKGAIGGQAPLKVAILFVGRIKAYEDVKENLQKIKDKYNPTVFCSLNKVNKTKYVQGFCDFMNISDDRLNIEKSPNPPEYVKKVNIPEEAKGGWGDGIAINNIHSFFYHLQKAYKLLETYQEKNGMQFDVVLYYRADILTNDDLIFASPLDEMKLYLPQTDPSCNHRGLCIICFYGSVNIMKIFCNMIDSIEDMCVNRAIFYNPEVILKQSVEDNNIRVERFPYNIELSPSRHIASPEANME
jgi:hypothetical protein